ncbi:protein Shroom4 [Pelodytes ibericus]
MDPPAVDGILQQSQCIHVQLQGGAPWGFTLKGGLEHGEPLIISKIEDGGKASMCEKMEVGDQLVNINGTPLYGSRQEALILIKGSYKILKMIVRRRNVSIVRPHSWHLAKLSEVHPDVANMQYPTDAFSLSWHSGCENSELPMQWNPLSRHCSTDKSSSIGSMESLDQPGQNYYEGTLSPIDPGMYQNKRDSAYSSFSASSNASDYTVSAKTEEPSATDCILQGLGASKQGDGRYLQTGPSAVAPQEEMCSLALGGNSQRPYSFPSDANHLGMIKSAPQPPVRRDSLRASKHQLNHGEKRRASAPGDSLQMSGRWSSEVQENRKYNPVQCQCGLGLCTVHLKESLLSDQYYMLSSQTDRAHQSIEKAPMKGHQHHENRREHGVLRNSELGEMTTQQAMDTLPNNSPCPRRISPFSPTNHTARSNLHTVSRSDEWSVTPSQEDHQFQKSLCNGETAKENLCNILRDSEVSQAVTLTNYDRLSMTNEVKPAIHQHSHLETAKESNKISVMHTALQQKGCIEGLRPSCTSEIQLDGSQKKEESPVPAKKPGSTRHRSAQMRRRSDRFATNLRNEIQRRKAQLQTSKGSSVLLCGEDPVEEREEPAECPSTSRPAPPPPPPKNKSRLLELKQANAERFRNRTDKSSLEQNSNNVTENSHKRPITPQTINIRENVVNGKSAMSRSPIPNDIISHCHHETVIYEAEQRDVPEHNENPSATFKRESEQRANTLSRSESSCEDVKDVATDVPCWNSKSPEMWESEIGEWTQATVRRGEASKASPVPGLKDSSEVCTMVSKSSSEDLENIVTDDTIQYKNHMPFSSDVGRAPQSNNEVLDSNGSARENWKASSMDNMDQEHRYQDEVKLHEMERMADHPSNSIHWKPARPPLSFDNHITNQMVNNGQWTWSPERKLQPHSHLCKGSPPDVMCVEGTISHMTEQNVLMPFADRRRIFEDSSKPPMPSHIPIHLKPSKEVFCPSFPDPPVSQMVSDLRRHSTDHTHHPSSPSRLENVLPYPEYCVKHPIDPPLCCNQPGHASEYLPSMPYGCRVHESCVYCSSDLCPAMLKRNISASHLSCHCHHYHHQWTRCNDCLCPAQHGTMEDVSSLHGDPWHMRKPMLQDVPMKEWTQQMKINRKCSQSVSELFHYNSGFHHSGPFRPCCEGIEQERLQYYRTVSSCDLSCDHPLRPMASSSSFQDGPPIPGLARGRAYSVSQLNLEDMTVRERRETPLAKLEEKEPTPAPLKKRGPPRPPPPNLENYRQRRASHQAASAGLPNSKERASLPGHISSVEAARQRSQSLPMNRARLTMAEAPPPSNCEEFPSGDHDSKPPEMCADPWGSRDIPTTGPPSPASTRLDPHSSSRVTPVDRSLARLQIGHNLPPEETSLPCSQESTLYEAEGALRAKVPEPTVADEPEDNDSHLSDPSVKPTDHLGSDGSEQVTLLEEFHGGYRPYEDDWSTDRESEMSIPDRYEFQPISPPPVCGAVSPTSCAAYYNTSTAKAELLNKMKDFSGVQEEGEKTEEEDELTLRKVQLIDSISRKLSVLHKAQQDLQEDITANTNLGCEVGELLKSLCKPNEYDKFRIFIGDLDKVVNLWLSLSGRLTRVESALSSEDPEPSLEEKLSLLEKKKQLTDQLEDAKELKAHVTRREQVVLEVVSRYLNEDQLQDYNYYVKMTSDLIVEQRELEDKIRLGEEQLRCLRESL